MRSRESAHADPRTAWAPEGGRFAAAAGAYSHHPKRFLSNPWLRSRRAPVSVFVRSPAPSSSRPPVQGAAGHAPQRHDPRDGRRRLHRPARGARPRHRRRGDDRIKAQDHFVDTIGCGPGWDLVTADLRDASTGPARSSRGSSRETSTGTPRASTRPRSSPTATRSARRSSRRLSGRADPRRRRREHRLRDVARRGSHVALGLLPSLTSNSSPRGDWLRASDPVSASTHCTASGSRRASPSRRVKSRRSSSTARPTGSRGAPRSSRPARSHATSQLDKQWFACDNWASSPFRGRCYLAYSDFRTNRISIQTSADGGLTWSAPIGGPDNAGRDAMREGSPGVQPVVAAERRRARSLLGRRPDVVDPLVDGGATFSRTNFIGRVEALWA